jgi:hypothetical protein
MCRIINLFPDDFKDPFAENMGLFVRQLLTFLFLYE